MLLAQPGFRQSPSSFVCNSEVFDELVAFGEKHDLMELPFADIVERWKLSKMH